MAMIERKAPPSADELAAVEDTLGIIDVSFYDLFKKRAEVASRLPPPDVAAVFSRLADSIRGITGQRKYDASALDMAAGLVAVMELAGRGVDVAVSGESPRSLHLLKSFYPLIGGVSFKGFERAGDAVAFAASSKNAVAMVPAAKASPKDMWWMGMLAKDMAGAKIIARLPFSGGADSDYIVARAAPAFGFDRSVLVLATSEPAASAWLKSALHRLEVPLYRVVDSGAVFNGSVLHLVELSRPIKDPGDNVFALDGRISGVAIRFAGYLGGYALPVVERDKIVEFRG